MRTLFIVAIIFFLAGAGALYRRSMLPSFVDADGILHEPFAWEASGKLLIIAAIICVLVSVLLWGLRKVRAPKSTG